MRQYLSSIFSSETLRIEVPETQWRSTAACLLLAAAVFGAGEGLARVALTPIGRSWEYWHPVAATKFEFVRTSIERGVPIRTLVVGDSTGALDVDPAPLERRLGGTAWNAAVSGNFPLAFEKTTLPLIEDPKLDAHIVLASFISSGFFGGDGLTTSEAAIVSSTYVQRQDSGRLVSDYLYLARLKTAWPLLLQSRNRADTAPSIRQYGFAPGRSRVSPETIRTEPIRTSRAELTARRTAVMDRLVQAAQRQHFTLAVVVPPSLSRSPERAQMTSEYLQFLAAYERRGQLRVLDYSTADFLRPEQFDDLNHLNADGAAVLSADIARRLAPL